MTLKVGALFAGYGGIELGLARVLDVEPAWFSEYEAAPSAILAHHWPTVPNHGDITRIDWTRVEPVDVITGGSPCQDLSHAGKRAGMRDGTRSGLWASMCDAIETIRPSLVVWENVRGALSAEADSAVEPCPVCMGDGGRVTLRALGRVLGDLAELGYDAAWCGLRAADVGAPHGRFRIFVTAWPATDTHGLRLERARGTRNGRHGPADGGQPSVTLLPTPAVNDMGAAYTPDTWDAWTQRMRAAHGNGNGHGASLHIEALRIYERETSDGNSAEAGPREVLRGVRRSDGEEAIQREARGYEPISDATDMLTVLREHASGCHKVGAPRESKEASSGCMCGVPDDGAPARPPRRQKPCEQRPGEPSDPVCVVPPAPSLARGPREAACGCASWSGYAPAIHRWESIVGRIAPRPTEPTGKDGAHRLSARAVEFMMGLPAGWVDVPGVGRNAQLKALGNGVVPQQAAAAIEHLLDVRAGVTGEVAA